MNHAILRLIAVAILIWYVVADLQGGDGGKAVIAVRIGTPPRIDGDLSDAVWNDAIPSGEFIQRDPDEGIPSSERTVIRVLYDHEAIYFGCFFHDSEPERIVSRLTRRDNEIESDRFSIFIDSYHDYQTAYEFTFNAAGVQVDILQSDDGEREDASWDPVWEVETRVLPDGWSAEVKIPFHNLRYQASGNDSAGSEWGLNMIRYISRKRESARWVFTPKNQSGFVSRFGRIEGLHHLPSPKTVELLPFVLGREVFLPSTELQSRRIAFEKDAGLDVRLGLWSNFTINATINPDFGQVEADPAVLNLTTFETFYPEKRPFFIEGTQIIRFSTFGSEFGPGMFYSRRIGRAIGPDEVYVPPGGRIERIPTAATILGAAKFTGKTDDGYSIGVLQAVTKEATARIVDATGDVSEVVVEPQAYFSVLRVRKDLMENSNVGMILTTVAKESRQPAFTAGWDWNVRLDRNTYQIDGFLGLSQTSNRAGEPLSGSAGRLKFGRISADHWFWSLSADFTSKKFNINDAGFFNRPNDFGAVATIVYAENRPSKVLRSYTFESVLHERRNFDGVNLMRVAEFETDLLLANYWSLESGIEADVGMYDDRETRGNGLYRRPSRYTWRGEISNDERDALVFAAEQRIDWDEKKKSSSQTSLSMTIKPFSWMDMEVDAEYGRARNEESWFTNIDIPGGRTSIFGDRNTEKLGLTFRTNVTFTRSLTLQLYGQIFLAKGEHVRLRELLGVGDFRPYTSAVDDASFNERSFNSNVVLRWEYLPGSILYVVWSQARQVGDGMYSSRFAEDIEQTFSVPPANVLLMKVSYWWSL